MLPLSFPGAEAPGPRPFRNPSACGADGGANPDSVFHAAVAITRPAPAPTPIVYAALGDSITLGGEASTPTNDYVSLVGAALNATVTNLGIGSEFSGPVNTTIGTATFVSGGVLADEVPRIPANANLVSLLIGTNDLWLAGEQKKAGGNPAALFPAVSTAYARNLRAIIAGIKARAPGARIVLLTVPNPAYRYDSGESAAVRAGITATDDAMRQDLKATAGAIVVDLQCDPELYTTADYPNPYDLHPNDAGHAEIAKDVLAALNGAKVSKACPYLQPS